MKFTNMLILVLVLTALLLTGCGGRRGNSRDTMPSENTTAATTMPTTMPTTQPTTEATTAPTTRPTTDSTEASRDHGNGPLPTDASEGMDEAGNNAKGRMMPRVK